MTRFLLPLTSHYSPHVSDRGPPKANASARTAQQGLPSHLDFAAEMTFVLGKEHPNDDTDSGSRHWALFKPKVASLMLIPIPEGHDSCALRYLGVSEWHICRRMGSNSKVLSGKSTDSLIHNSESRYGREGDRGLSVQIDHINEHVYRYHLC